MPSDDRELRRHLAEEQRLRERLGGLDPAGRAAACAGTAERLLRYLLEYRRSGGAVDTRAVRALLDRVWERAGRQAALSPPPLRLWRRAFEQGFELSEATAHPARLAVWAVSSATHVAVHDRMPEALHCLGYGDEAARHLALAGGAVPALVRHHPLVAAEQASLERSLTLLERHGPTAAVVAALREDG